MFGHGLDDGTRKGDRAGAAGQGHGHDVHIDARLHGSHEGFTELNGQGQGAGDAAGAGTDGSLEQFVHAADRRRRHFYNDFHAGPVGHADGDVLAVVDNHSLEVVDGLGGRQLITRADGPLAKGQPFQRVDEAVDIATVLLCGIAIFAGNGIDDIDLFSEGAETDPVVSQQEILFRIPCIIRDAFGCA